MFNFSNLHQRMNFGQLREAVMGRMAHAEGAPVVVARFRAPSQDEVCERLARAGLPESGMKTLTMGRGGPKLERSSTVGWVYWGRLAHLARSKVMFAVSSQERGQMQGELETTPCATLARTRTWRST